MTRVDGRVAVACEGEYVLVCVQPDGVEATRRGG
jgi:hypothetical protein